MNRKLRLAIANNNDIYSEVFGIHDRGFVCADDIWFSSDPAPPLYSNIVTRSPEWHPDGRFAAVETAYKEQGWPGWSIKDSFAALNLAPLGFGRLFSAQWVYLESPVFKRLPGNVSGTRLRYGIARTETELSAWQLAWSGNEQAGNLAGRIYTPALLRNPRVFFVCGYDGERVTAGCILNTTEDVMGISNFFAPGPEARYWGDLIGFAFESFGPVDLVGYERDPEVLAALTGLGFETAGDLTVWTRQ